MAVDVRMLSATVSDAKELVADLRPADAAELAAVTGGDPLTVIVDGLLDSDESWSLYFDGRLACMWGVLRGPETMLGGSHGCGWLLTTSLVDRHAKTFWRVCLAVMPDVLDRWDELANAIDARHTQALRWARRLGFRVEPADPLGVAALPFHRFTVRKEYLPCAHHL